MVRDLTERGFRIPNEIPRRTFDIITKTDLSSDILSNRNNRNAPFIVTRRLSFSSIARAIDEVSKYPNTGIQSFLSGESDKYRLFNRCARCGRITRVNVVDGIFSESVEYYGDLCEDCREEMDKTRFEEIIPDSNGNAPFFHFLPAEHLNLSLVCNKWRQFLAMD